jgi:hypothetical protein
MSILLFFFAVFTLCGITGYRWYRSRFWDLADLIYFPLAAVALVLFLVNVDLHRQFLGVREALFSKRQVLFRDQLEKLGLPKLQNAMGKELKPVEFAEIHAIATYARSCADAPASSIENHIRSGGVRARFHEPATMPEVPKFNVRAECAAARNYLPALTEFEEMTWRDKRKHRFQLVDKLYSDCSAAGVMLEALRSDQRINAPIAEGMVETFQTLRETGINPSRIREDARPLIQAHVKRNQAYSKELNRNSGQEFSEDMRHALEVRSNEAELSGKILSDLLPCAILTPANFELLRITLHKDSLFELRRARLDVMQRVHSQAAARVHAHPWMAWLRLDLWPYLLAVVVSLKFGRVLASRLRDRIG